LSHVNELAEYLKSQGYEAVQTEASELRVLHPSLPVYLLVEFRDNFAYMSIKHSEELREVLEDLRDDYEDVEGIVEEALSYLSLASLKVRMWVEERGYTSVFKLRDGSIEIYEILEEVLEEREEEA